MTGTPAVVEGLRLGGGLGEEVVLGVLREQVRRVLWVRLGGVIAAAAARHGALAGQRRQSGREGGQLGRGNGGRERRWQGGEVRSRAGQDGAVGADHWLDAGHSVHRPERGEEIRGDTMKTKGDVKKRRRLSPVSSSVLKSTAQICEGNQSSSSSSSSSPPSSSSSSSSSSSKQITACIRSLNPSPKFGVEIRSEVRGHTQRGMNMYKKYKYTEKHTVLPAINTLQG